MAEQERWVYYAGMITSAIGSMIEDEHAEYSISKEELYEDDNLTHFIHALANVAPTYIHNAITNNKVNQLDFNHMANKLCFQFSNGEDKIKGDKLLEAVNKIRNYDPDPNNELEFRHFVKITAEKAIEEYKKEE